MTEQNQRIDFDDYAERYEEMLHRELSYFSSDRCCLSSYKTHILARVRDFDCGIGLSLSLLHLIAACSLDTDAVLLPHRKLKRLFPVDELKIRDQGHCRFSPGLKGLARLEPALDWLPLGGRCFASGGR